MDQNKERPLHENHRARMKARVERDGLESLAEHEATGISAVSGDTAERYQ